MRENFELPVECQENSGKHWSQRREYTPATTSINPGLHGRNKMCVIQVCANIFKLLVRLVLLLATKDRNMFVNIWKTGLTMLEIKRKPQ